MSSKYKHNYRNKKSTELSSCPLFVRGCIQDQFFYRCPNIRFSTSLQVQTARLLFHNSNSKPSLCVRHTSVQQSFHHDQGTYKARDSHHSGQRETKQFSARFPFLSYHRNKVFLYNSLSKKYSDDSHHTLCLPRLHHECTPDDCKTLRIRRIPCRNNRYIRDLSSNMHHRFLQQMQTFVRIDCHNLFPDQIRHRSL